MNETKPKKMVSRSVAITLGLVCIVLIALIAYFTVTGISAQNSYNNLQNQNKQLQTWLNGNETLLNQTQADNTNLQNQIDYLNSTVTNLQNQLNSLTAPTYSLVSNSFTTNAGSLYTFSTLWTDEVNVSGYIFETNNTGVFVNDTWTPFSNFTNPTSAYASVTKTLNSNVGDFVSWTFWCNNTRNHWTEIPIQSFLVVSQVLLETTQGDITIQLFGDMPITSGNFLNLTETGVYDGTNFTRIAPGFVIQGGDASAKGITVENITDELPNKHTNVQWTVGMAKLNGNGRVVPNSASDQFYINLADNSAALDANFTVFGVVVSGFNVVDKISQLVPSGSNATGYDGPPSTPVTITIAQLTS